MTDSIVKRNIVNIIVTAIGYNYDEINRKHVKQQIVDMMDKYVKCNSDVNNIADVCIECYKGEYNNLDTLNNLLDDFTFTPYVLESEYLNITHFLSQEDLIKYHEKMIPYRINHNDTVSICPKTNNLNDGYLFNSGTDNEISESDKKFVNKENTDATKIVLFGYHTYGGYRGFFRPDFTEIIHMLNTEISLNELNNIDKIYVTTEPHPLDNLCYSNTLDKHRARTTYYVYKKHDMINRKRKAVDKN